MRVLKLQELRLTQIMEASGVIGPFVDGMIHGGHLGGTVPLTKDDVETMHPSWLPREPLGCRPFAYAPFSRFTDDVNCFCVVFAGCQENYSGKRKAQMN